MTLAAVYSRRGEQWDAVRVVVPGARSGEPHGPLTSSHRTPADGWIVLHKGLRHREK